MRYREMGSTGLKVSCIGLGGHEFGENGFIRGFQDDAKLAVTRGYVFDGFGQENRKAIVKRALDLGINFFDVTIDSEKEAMGRILSDLGAGDEIIIQTRPEGMVYTYDPENRQMADFNLLREEVARICNLLKRDHVDILNFAFMKEALLADPDYLDKIGDNITRLKSAGLIRFASADTFSGESTYLRQYKSRHFDTTFINYNILEEAMSDEVIPTAARIGMAIFTREAFMKARLFRFAENAGITDRGLVARASIKWILSNDRITAAVIGVSTPEQLEENVSAAESSLTEEEAEVISAIQESELFAKALTEKRLSFKR